GAGAAGGLADLAYWSQPVDPVRWMEYGRGGSLTSTSSASGLWHTAEWTHRSQRSRSTPSYRNRGGRVRSAAPISTAHFGSRYGTRSRITHLRPADLAGDDRQGRQGSRTAGLLRPMESVPGWVTEGGCPGSRGGPRGRCEPGVFRGRSGAGGWHRPQRHRRG